MKIHLFGNCQTMVLANLLREDHPDWRITNTALPGDMDAASVQAHVAALDDADVVISQPVLPWYNIEELSLDAVRALRRPGSTLLVIPSMFFDGQHSAFQYLGNRLQGLGMPYHNVHVVDMFLRGYRWAEIRTLMACPDFYDARTVEKACRASLDELRRREELAEVDVAVSDLIEEAFRTSIPMNTINHPKRAIVVALLNRLYGLLSLPRQAREAGRDYLPDPLIPPLPSVLNHMGLRDDRPEFHIAGRVYTRDTYTMASLAYYDSMDSGILSKALAGSNAFQVFDTLPQWRPFPSYGFSLEADQVRALEWINAVFISFMGRRLSDAEEMFHLRGLQSAGPVVWLDALAKTPEFRMNFRRQRVGAAFLEVGAA